MIGTSPSVWTTKESKTDSNKARLLPKYREIRASLTPAAAAILIVRAPATPNSANSQAAASSSRFLVSCDDPAMYTIIM